MLYKKLIINNKIYGYVYLILAHAYYTYIYKISIISNLLKSLPQEYPLLLYGAIPTFGDFFLSIIVKYEMLIMNLTETRIAKKIKQITAVADEFPFVTVIHRFTGNSSSVVYMSKKGLDYFNSSLEDLKAQGDDYFLQFVNQQDAEDYIPKILGMIERNDENEVFTFFQQISRSVAADWQWHLSTIKILMRDEDKNPLLLIITAVPVNHSQHITSSNSRLLVEHNFIHKNYRYFESLTPREKSVLRLIAQGKSNKEISIEIFISVNTSETHRKNIKAKLKANSLVDLYQYASAFDLV